MAELSSSIAGNFSLTRGGPLHRLLVRTDRGENERRRVIRRALFATLITWLPLLILSLVEGLAYGSRVKIPFLRDFAVNVRFLVALPILILAESRIDQRWRVLVLEFLRSGLINETELPFFEAAIEKIARLRDRVLPETVMIAAVYYLAIFINKTELLMSGTSSWHTVGIGYGHVSLAGWWFNLVSTPFFRFLLLRWAWRMFLWTLFLWRISRIKLYLVPTHTDMAAGLGFLAEGQKVFSTIVFAGGAVVASQVGNAIAFEGATLSSMKFPMIAYGVIAIVVLVLPLLSVTPVLLKTKRKALLEYGALVARHDQLFHAKWIGKRPPPDEVLLGNPDAASLAQLGSSFSVVRGMRVVPIDRPTLISLAAAAALPMAPVLVYATPTNELVKIVLKMLA